MDEIIFESSGSIEHFTDIEYLNNSDNLHDNGSDPIYELETVRQLEVVEEEPEEDLEEDPEEKLEEEAEEQLEEEQEELKEENKEEGNNNDIFQVSNVQTDLYISDDLERLSDNQIVVVSENIINKPLNEYTVSESLQLYIFISIFVAGFIVLVRRAVLKWS